MNFREVMLVLALSAMAASAQAAGGGASTGGISQSTGTGSAGASTGGISQSTGTTTGGVAQQSGTGQGSANTQTTGQSITGLPLSNPTEIQAQRNQGAGTAPNGLPIGSSGSGLGSPEQPINSFNSGRR